MRADNTGIEKRLWDAASVPPLLTLLVRLQAGAAIVPSNLLQDLLGGSHCPAGPA